MSKFYDNIELLQRFAGVTVDRRFGEETAEALVKKLGLAPRAPDGPRRAASELLVCLDPGHGMSNRTAGVFDPGCTNEKLEESRIAWEWAGALEQALTKRNVPVIKTRNSYDEPSPLGSRAKFAKDCAATHFISIHVNDATPTASGTETLIANKFVKPMAQALHRPLVETLGLRDRGIKFRDDLAVLKTGSIPSVLIELGFIRADARAICNPAKMKAACEAMAAALLIL